jgi:membrane complex biogenesis BtpA family protein
VLHLPPLPGSPLSSRAVAEIATDAAHDAVVLADAGFDAVIVENYGDVPFLQRVGPVTVSAMTHAALRVRDAAPGLSLGINILRNDAEAAMAVAAVVGASFVRVNVHVGARVTDQGVIQGEAGATLRARRAMGAESIGIWADVDVKHSAPLGVRPIADEAADAVVRGLASALLVTGEGTGRAVELSKLAAVRAAVSVPIYVASGATESSLSALASTCDGVVVGTAICVGGKAGQRVDRGRAESFSRAFRAAFRRS